MRNTIHLLFLILFFSHTGYAQTSTALHTKTSGVLTMATPESVHVSSERLRRIDSNLAKWVSDGRTNGCVALVVRDGKIIYQKAFGYNDEEKTIPIRTNTIYRIASQTKAITSVAVMMLYEEGKLLLDDPISLYIPEFAKPRILDQFHPEDSSYTTKPAKSEITIRQLLTHTSGIGYAQIGSKESNAIYSKAGISAGIGVENGKLLADDMKKLGRLPLLHEPGEKFTYGLNADVLGYLVEILSGMPLDQFFRTRIFEPLGMKDTYFNLPQEKQNRLASLFQEEDGKISKAPDVIHYNGNFIVNYPNTAGTYFSGGAGLSSTALDYAIFLQMILNGGEYNGRRLLARNTVRMMTMNQIGDIAFGANKFGLGFQITTEKGSSLLPTPEGVFEWGGAFATTYWADPKEKLIGIIYRQLWGSTQGNVPNKFKVLVYQALND